MSVRITCTGCQNELKAREELRGKRVRCPKCGQHLTIPPEGAVSAGPPPAKAASQPTSAIAKKPLPPTAPAAPRRSVDKGAGAPPVKPQRRGQADKASADRSKKPGNNKRRLPWPWILGGAGAGVALLVVVLAVVFMRGASAPALKQVAQIKAPAPEPTALPDAKTTPPAPITSEVAAKPVELPAGPAPKDIEPATQPPPAAANAGDFAPKNDKKGGKEFAPKNGMYTIVMPDGKYYKEIARVIPLNTNSQPQKPGVGTNIKSKLKKPATPSVAAKTLKLAVEGSTTMLEDKTTNFGVASIGIPAALMREIPKGRRFEVFSNSLADQMKGKISGEKDVTQDSVAGKEYQIEKPDGFAKLRLHIIAGFVIYVVTEARNNDDLSSKTAEAFFQSFKLTDKAQDLYKQLNKDSDKDAK